jgi:hypothetical protein
VRFSVRRTRAQLAARVSNTVANASTGVEAGPLARQTRVAGERSDAVATEAGRPPQSVRVKLDESDISRSSPIRGRNPAFSCLRPWHG